MEPDQLAPKKLADQIYIGSKQDTSGFSLVTVNAKTNEKQCFKNRCNGTFDWIVKHLQQYILLETQRHYIASLFIGWQVV